VIGILDAVIKITAVSTLRMKEIADAADTVFIEDMTICLRTYFILNTYNGSYSPINTLTLQDGSYCAQGNKFSLK
jgi:hypothetical protein